MNAPLPSDAFVRSVENGLSSLTCTLVGVQCGGCTNKIERRVSSMGGVISVRANATTKRLRFVWDPAVVKIDELINAVEELGYSAHPLATELEGRTKSNLLIPLAVAGFGTMNVMMFSLAVWAGIVTDMGPGTVQFMHWLSAGIAIPVCIYSGSVFFLPAIRSLRAGHMTIDTSISLAILTTLLASVYETFQGAEHAYFDAAVSLVFFLLIGRVLDQSIRKKSSAASDNLRAMTQGTAKRIGPGGQIEHVLADDLSIGDVIYALPGERIAADGNLLFDIALVDESILTGETLPRTVVQDQPVIAGSVVVGQAARVKVTAVGADGRIAEIADIVEAAEARKGRQQLLADKFASAYGPVVIGASLVGFLIWYFFLGASFSQAAMIAVAVMVVTCPCAAGLATPAVVVRAINQLLSRGVIVKNGEALERLAEIDQVVVDKTGTLTTSKLALENSVNQKTLQAASAIAANSQHPLARALGEVCPAKPMAGVVETIGAGLVAPNGAKLGSARFLKINGHGDSNAPELWYRDADGETTRLRFRDIIKPDAANFVASLQMEGLGVELLSGDKSEATRDVANRMGISSWFGEMGPEDKCQHVMSLEHSDKKVLMIGDGINDAPSLAAAYVSISPATAAHISQNASDIVLAGSSLLPVVGAIKMARNARKLINQNMLFATAYNLVALPLALAGGLTPLIAAILMSSSSILVMLNAFRLKMPQ